MSPLPIGIVGGAGPLAGATLFNHLIRLATSLYGCCKDADFPKILLLSFPFSEMLSTDINTPKLRQELYECLDQLRQNGASLLAIACNTLHIFLDKNQKDDDLIFLPQTIVELGLSQPPLVLCTSTSARFELHKQFFPCLYPDSNTQDEVDCIIDQLLKGQKPSQALIELINDQAADTIILGCTELSLLTNELSSCKKTIIDPLEIIARKLLEKSFSNPLR